MKSHSRDEVQTSGNDPEAAQRDAEGLRIRRARAGLQEHDCALMAKVKDGRSSRGAVAGGPGPASLPAKDVDHRHSDADVEKALEADLVGQVGCSSTWPEAEKVV